MWFHFNFAFIHYLNMQLPVFEEHSDSGSNLSKQIQYRSVI